MLINKKLAYAIATGAIVMNAFAPAAIADTAAGSIGNGAESTNTVNLTQNNNSTVTQNNSASITNSIHSNSTTGGNDANFNTGGDSKIQTGSATNAVSISNTANSNQLNMGANAGSTDPLVKNSGNGAFSTNNANLTTNNNNTATQNNAAEFVNTVDSNAKTGGNSASDNTGGDTSIRTGKAKNTVEVDNAANKNVMTGGVAFGNSGATTLSNDGNGAISDNTINDTLNNNATATQNNAAEFANIITGGAATGKNKGDFNTDGSTGIMTGSAINETGVANMANENVINALDCGCATTTGGDLFKNADNGSFATSTVNATKNNNKTATQNNAAGFDNAVDTDAFTGNNSVSDATGSYFYGGTSEVMTGASGSQTQVSNASNDNEISSNGMSFGGMTFTWNPTQMFGFMGW